jgi:hypothetical protein
MRGARSPRSSVLAAAAFVLVSARASAAPEDLATAEKLFEQAQRELAAGNLAEACPRLAESRRLDPQVGVTLYLADCLQRSGKIASAWGMFRDAAQAATAKNDARAAIAKKRADAIEPRVAMLTIAVPPETDVSGLEILKDDEPVARAQWNVPVPVDPGEHVVTARARGHQPSKRLVTIDKDGQRAEVTIARLSPEPVAPGVTPALASSSPRAEPPPAKRKSRTLSYVLLGGAAAAAGAGAVFGALAAGTADDVKTLCPAYPACTPATTADATRINDDAQMQATVSTVAFGVSAVALAAGLMLLFGQ